MGASSSSPRGSPQVRPKHQHKERQSHGPDIARGNNPTPADNSYRQTSNIHVGPIVRTDTVHSGEYDNNVSAGARVTVHTDIPSQTQHRTPVQDKHQSHHPARGNIHLGSDSDEEEERLRSPAIIRSSPEPRSHHKRHPHGKEQSHPQGNKQSHPQGNKQSHPQGKEQSHPQGKGQSHPQGKGQSHLHGKEHSHPHGKEHSHPHGKEHSHPHGKEYKPNTIKQAKVNVKDRISKFTELPAAQENRPKAALSHGHLHVPPNNHLLSVPQHYDSSVRRGSEASALKHLKANKSHRSEFTHRMEEEKKTITPIQASKKRSERRRGSEPAVFADHHLMAPRTIPAPDYDDITVPDGVTAKVGGEQKIHRINTLEYFDQLTSGHMPLKAFEKAKPARAIHKANSPLPKRAYTPREQKEDNGMRPKSMFLPPTNYSSDLDITAARNQSNPSNDDLVSANQSDDDLDHIAKKKMAGQRLPIGEVDPQIESKFLKSLKRNIELREAKHTANGRPTSKSLDNLVF